MYPELAYQEKVLSGEIPSCKFVTQACERNARDLLRQHEQDPDFPYMYSTEHAQHAINWIQLLHMTQGRKFMGRPFELAPWQKFIIACLFGWLRKDKDTAVRRFKYCYVEIARKNGKSELAAAIGLYMLLADGELGAEVACAASRLEQAKIVSKRACLMAAITPELQQTYNLKIYNTPRVAGEIHEGESNGFLRAVASDKSGSQDGQNIHAALIDEVHAHKDRSMWEALEFATGSREQPLIFAITTAGDDKTGIAYEQHQITVDILSGTMQLDEYFGLIYTIDDPSAWDQEPEWIKANPNLGVSVNLDDLRVKCRKAKISKSAKFGFMLKHLDVWLNEAQAWLDPQVVANSALATSWEHMRNYPCYIGFDLSSKKDITSIAYCFETPHGKHLMCRNYLPEGALEEEHNGEKYLNWAEAGHLVLTEGAKIAYQQIYEQLLQDCRELDVKRIGYDRTHAEQLVQRLDKETYVDLVEVPQTANHFSDPMKELEADLLDSRCTWDPNPCVEWMLLNTQAKSQGPGKIRPFKTKEEKKIDAAVACLLAYKMANLPQAPMPFIQSLQTQDAANKMRPNLQIN